MKSTSLPLLSLALGASFLVVLGASVSQAQMAGDDLAPRGWLSWRGPDQNGTSSETGLVDSLSLEDDTLLWSYPIAGRGTPVIADGRVFGLGYEGEPPAVEEVLFCLDEATGERLWEYRSTDFLSDIIYSRYAIGSPTVDPETGHVFTMTAAGLLRSFTRDGQLLWEVSMGETLGRLTFPNGRTGAPLILDDLVIVHFIFASWGPLGPARDRFFAFDKSTGRVVWSSTPGGRPRDSSFCMPVLEERDGRTLFYAGLGGGHVVCVDARTGDPVWRYPFSIGGLNSALVLHGDHAIAIHGKENRDSSVIGRMVALDLTAKPDEQGVLPDSAEVWRNDLVAFTSSPVLVGDLIYQTIQTGELVCVDAKTGEELWHEKLGPDQLHASPLAADGKLYVPLTNGKFFCLAVGREGAERLGEVQLEGNCLGAPAVSGGRIYVHTTDRLYCFGKGGSVAPEWPKRPQVEAGPPVRLQIVPADVTLRAGEKVDFEVRQLDASGRVAGVLDPGQVRFDRPALLEEGSAGVGVLKAEYEGPLGPMVGTARVRAVRTLPFVEDFAGRTLNQTLGEPFAFPPGEWLGAHLKWMIVEREGEPMLARRIDRPLFQRTMTFIGHPDDANYTIQIDLNSEGTRRSMCDIGVINQRYKILLRGNYQELEVSSNDERLKVAVPFSFKKRTWYTLKARVDVAADGSGLIRAKAWPREEAEPEDWTLEVTDPKALTHGAAGLFGFTPQSRFTAYIDNLSVTPNE